MFNALFSANFFEYSRNFLNSKLCGTCWAGRDKKCPAPRGGRAPRYILCEAVTSLPLIGFLFRFLKCAPLHVTNIRSVRISASGGDDDRRRAFPPPRRWWQLCVTPYFATRGRGDMRGVPNRSCTHSHPGGGAGLCFRRGAVCIILCVNGVKHSRVVQ